MEVPKFKVGDIVVCKRDGGLYRKGKSYKITSFYGELGRIRVRTISLDGLSSTDGWDQDNFYFDIDYQINKLIKEVLDFK